MMIVALSGFFALLLVLIVGDVYRRGELGVLVVFVLLAWAGMLTGALYVIVEYPPHVAARLQTAKSRLTLEKDKFEAERDVLKAETDARQAVVQGFAGIVVLGGLYFTYRTLTGTARTALLQRYTDAVGLLGKSEAETLAGVVVLRAIAREPEGKDLQITSILTDITRKHDTDGYRAAAKYLNDHCAG